MEVHRKFLELLEEKGLVSIGENSDLAGSIGIDGDWWLNRIVPIDRKSELLGSITMSLRPCLSEGLKHFSNLNLNPVLVFSGIPLNTSGRGTNTRSWEQKADDNENLEINPLEVPRHIEAYYTTFDMIKLSKGQAMRAPYFPSAQLLALYQTGKIQHVMGMTDLIFYEVPVIIIDMMQTKYKYVETAKVFQALQLTSKEIKQAFIMNGYFGKNMTDVPLEALFESMKYVRAEMLTSDIFSLGYYSNVVDCKVHLSSGPPGLGYERGDFIKAYGQKLPKELYFALGFLNISPKLFYMITHNRIEEKQPSGDSNNYRKLQKAIKDVKSTTISILSSIVDEKYFKNPIKVQYWYSEIQDEVALKPYTSINWKITISSLNRALIQHKKLFPDIYFCLKWHMEDWGNKKELINLSTTKNLEETKTSDTMYLLARINLSFLEAIGYIFPTGCPSLFGKSLINIDPEWQFSGFYLQELLKYGLLNGRTLNQNQCSNTLSSETYEKLCGISTDDSSRHAIVLISRVFSLVQPTLKEEVWTGEIDYDLAQFHSLINLIFNSYQQIFEAIVLKEFLSCKEINKNYCEISKMSPLLPYPHPALGIAIKRLLIYDDINQVAMEMPQMVDLYLDLHRGWMFWKSFVKIMNIFRQYNAVPENTLMNDIAAASKKLKNALLRARIHISN
ncbi:hypothetical protein SteCoe_15035 [Stentor coeruleus]|uniref:XPG N-terminal domain-containing protein n=1 Tax=Stentor coeruleus TaxID=5963 RepID=A0A1R2C4N8_9CILI|nr:hypothetical protein SteCoe_15035 [Stentor coeruleus]